MLLNYHELTMGESPDSPSRRKQFRIICAVMLSAIVYTVISTGALRPVELSDGMFEGGEFVYKTTGRDYAASMSLLEHVAQEGGIKERDYDHVMYTVYLDDPLLVNGRRQRFACGILVSSSKEIVTKKYDNNPQALQEALWESNKSIKDPTEDEISELAVYDLWKRLKYQSQTLPSAKAAVAKYPFTNGFVSALLHSYKVFPALREYARTNGAPPGVLPVIITTCSIKNSECTHYAPYTDIETFRLGQPEQEAGNFVEGMVNWEGVKNMALKIVSLGQKGKDTPIITTKTATTTPNPQKEEKEAIKPTESSTESEHELATEVKEPPKEEQPLKKEKEPKAESLKDEEGEPPMTEPLKEEEQPKEEEGLHKEQPLNEEEPPAEDEKPEEASSKGEEPVKAEPAKIEEELPKEAEPPKEQPKEELPKVGDEPPTEEPPRDVEPPKEDEQTSTDEQPARDEL